MRPVEPHSHARKRRLAVDERVVALPVTYAAASEATDRDFPDAYLVLVAKKILNAMWESVQPLPGEVRFSGVPVMLYVPSTSGKQFVWNLNVSVPLKIEPPVTRWSSLRLIVPVSLVTVAPSIVMLSTPSDVRPVASVPQAAVPAPHRWRPATGGQRSDCRSPCPARPAGQ